MCDYTNDNECISKLDIIKEEIIIEEGQEIKPVIKQEIHSVDKPHKCDQCSTNFKKLYSLTKHKAQVHGKGGKFACEKCDKKYLIKSKLKQHLITHSDVRNFQCDLCDKTFKRKVNLSVHKKTVHATEWPFRCEVCSKAFSSAKYLDGHSRYVHSVVKPHKCEQCSKSFTSPYHLRHHIRQLHLNEGKYSCDLCEKIFVRLSIFKQHLVSHSSQKDFECNDCDKKYKTKAHLIRHRRCAHLTQRSFQEEKVVIRAATLAETFVTVKVEPVTEYDKTEERRMVLDIKHEIKDEIELGVKLEPQIDFNE